MQFGMSINFAGNCREAVTFYAGVFGLEPPRFLTYGEGDTSHDPNYTVSENMKDKILSVKLDIAGATVDFSDMPDAFEFIRGNGMYLSVTCGDAQKAGELFHRLGEGGQAPVPFGPVPGMGHYGMVVDQYQLGWIIKA